MGHETALDLVSGANFGCNRHCMTNPVDLEGSQDQVLVVSFLEGLGGINHFSIVAKGRLRKSGYLKAVWPEFVGSFLGVWAAPGGFETFQKCGGRSPLHFWMVSKPPGAAQTPKTDP